MELFVIFLAVLGAANAQECGEGQFLCNQTNVCIPNNRVCDGVADCAGGSDEVNCAATTTTQCPGFECPTGDCLPSDWICDGWDDCGDESDEENCPTTPCSGYVCTDGDCISDGWVCDGDNDCGDWSDESEEACPCSDNEMRCPKPPGSNAPGPCIPPEYICDVDGIWDCPDGSDETNCTTTVNIHKVPRYRPETLRLAKERRKIKNISRQGRSTFKKLLGSGKKQKRN